MPAITDIALTFVSNIRTFSYIVLGSDGQL